MATCPLTVSEVAQFTITGPNESVTCALNAVFNGSVVAANETSLQLELCKGESIAKIPTGTNVSGLPDTTTSRNLLQASEVCYSQETILQVTSTATYDFSSQIRSLLYGNVDIRALYTCGGNVYVQIPPEDLLLAEKILSNCNNLSSVPCYQPVPLPCSCVPVFPSVGVHAISQESSPNSATVTLTGVTPRSSIYVAVQVEVSLGTSLSNMEVHDDALNCDPTGYSLDKVSINSLSRAVLYAFVFHCDNVSVDSNGNLVITYTATVSPNIGFSYIEAVEILGAANPSLDSASVAPVSLGYGSDLQPYDSFTASTAGELGFLSSVFHDAGTTPVIGPLNGSTILNNGNDTGSAVADLYQPFDSAGIKTVYSQVTETTPVSTPNPQWAAAAVGILPASNNLGCPLTNCRFPVPDCHFEYPCALAGCCKKKKK